MFIYAYSVKIPRLSACFRVLGSSPVYTPEHFRCTATTSCHIGSGTDTRGVGIVGSAGKPRMTATSGFSNKPVEYTSYGELNVRSKAYSD